MLFFSSISYGPIFGINKNLSDVQFEHLRGPALVAWLGGSHTDSRFRRGMGGTLHPEYDVGREMTYEIHLITSTFQLWRSFQYHSLTLQFLFAVSSFVKHHYSVTNIECAFRGNDHW